ncbi:PspC domain-containing protein [Neolewinella aurantiaca]|uniref:PspC domain-containing protein n=1 Tax=Neolewinella aurantiaca TaxID=2602767 RepID=A0A5C7FMB9_9BACT|nr:PspC domain-containing protein [Neolewinella aurantiaca]TXF88586.1 PspC domain-containing protein [Neolewinella aurantiaca]
MDILRNKVERVAFGVCAWMADRMGIQRRRVRMYFIYLSCLSLGSSVLFYLFAAFWLNVREYMREGKRRLIRP